MTDPQPPSGFRPPAPPPYTGQAASSHAATGQAPTYQAPAGAYQVPIRGYTASPMMDARATRSSRPGVLALLLALVAAVITPVVAGIALSEIGRRLPTALQEFTPTGDSQLAFLSPVRDQVLWVEVSFWAGTALGIAAIVMGIIAIARRRGRPQGIAAFIIAIAAPIIFGVVCFAFAVSMSYSLAQFGLFS